MVPNLILIYGVVALVIGLFFAMSITVLDEFWIENVGPDGTYYGVTYGQLESTMVWMTVAFLSSGLCATVSGILARRMVYGRVCLILCLLAWCWCSWPQCQTRITLCTGSFPSSWGCT